MLAWRIRDLGPLLGNISCIITAFSSMHLSVVALVIFGIINAVDWKITLLTLIGLPSLL
jgi:hypothetical protein